MEKTVGFSLPATILRGKALHLGGREEGRAGLHRRDGSRGERIETKRIMTP